ncbi:MAG TPA: hypothetical protein VGO76_11380 [Luteibacter sp.]|jgi:hypothetical protein|nr:hypothetical protein [Luteibacter sp.]
MIASEVRWSTTFLVVDVAHCRSAVRVIHVLLVHGHRNNPSSMLFVQERREKEWVVRLAILGRVTTLTYFFSVWHR